MPGNDNNIFSRAGSSASTAERNTSPALQVLKSKRLPEWLRIRLVLRRHSVRCAMRSSREKEHVVRVFLASLKSSTLVKHPRASNALWARRDVWDGPSPTPNQFSVCYITFSTRPIETKEIHKNLSIRYVKSDLSSRFAAADSAKHGPLDKTVRQAQWYPTCRLLDGVGLEDVAALCRCQDSLCKKNDEC